MKNTNIPPPKKKTAMQNRRYYLHRKLRKIGYSIHVKSRTVLIPWSLEFYCPREAFELRDKFHYSLQLIID